MFRQLAALALLLRAATVAVGATGEETYRARCSLCHDSGATAAPRVSDPQAWAARVANGRASIYETALRGKPNTAMLPKGGFPELPDDDVRAAVDFMLLAAGFRDVPLTASPAAARADKPAPAIPAPTSRAGPVDDRTIVADVAEALRRAPDVAPANARLEVLEGVTIVQGAGIRVEARDGVVTLRGMVDRAAAIPRAEAIARGVGGVRAVDNKLIESGLFEHD
jgi:cytochrome c5